MKKSIVALFLFFQQLYAGISGKIDTGPVFVSIDKLEKGKTVETLDLWGIKSDAVFVFDNGIALKPSVITGQGDNTRFYSMGAGLGVCLPLCEGLYFLPNAGCFFGKFRTNLDCKVFGLPVEETIRTTSPYIGFDLSYEFLKGWKICGVFQYTWSKVVTKYQFDRWFLNPWAMKWCRHVATFRDHTQGINLSLLLEKDLFENISISLGCGYNNSLSREKRGLRGKGLKVGLVYNF